MYKYSTQGISEYTLRLQCLQIALVSHGKYLEHLADLGQDLKATHVLTTAARQYFNFCTGVNQPTQSIQPETQPDA